MKIIWFTQIPLPIMLNMDNRTHSGSGSWIAALYERLSQNSSIDLTVICTYPGVDNIDVQVSETTRLILISQGKARRLFYFNQLDDNPLYLDICVDWVNRIKPDIIHIHGTESFYGLITSRDIGQIPVVISLQGLLHELIRFRNYFGCASIKSIISLRSIVNSLRGASILTSYLHTVRNAKRELEIIRLNHWFIGRTHWDYAHVKCVNPNANYVSISEIMREEFYESQWNIDSCIRYRLINTNTGYYRSGTEVLLNAVHYLKRDNPDVQLVLAGNFYDRTYKRSVFRRVNELGLTNNVLFLGRIVSKQLVIELLKSHVFVTATFIDNSPNSLCEAQLVGLPCVAPYVGGIPSLVNDGLSGLFYPLGDAAVMAENIRNIFLNDDMATSLGAEARQVALKRHDRDTVINEYIATYKRIIETSKSVV